MTPTKILPVTTTTVLVTVIKQTTVTHTKTKPSVMATPSVQTTEMAENHQTIYPPCETCGKTNHYTEKHCFGATATNRLPPRNRRPMEQSQIQQQDTETSTIESAQAAAHAFN